MSLAFSWIRWTVSIDVSIFCENLTSFTGKYCPIIHVEATLSRITNLNTKDKYTAHDNSFLQWQSVIIQQVNATNNTARIIGKSSQEYEDFIVLFWPQNSISFHNYKICWTNKFVFFNIHRITCRT